MTDILPEIHTPGYVSLTTFRKHVSVSSPIRFAERAGKLHIMTRDDRGKYERIRNNPRVAPWTIRGQVTGPEFPATARVLPQSEWPQARAAIQKKYCLGPGSVSLEQAECVFGNCPLPTCGQASWSSFTRLT